MLTLYACLYTGLLGALLYVVPCSPFSPRHRSSTKYFLVFELVPGGELFERIVDRHHFSEHDAARCVQAIMVGSV